MNGNKITILRDPTSDEDAATKIYVDAVDSKLSTLKSEHDTVDGKLSALTTEHENHIAVHNTLWAEYDVHVDRFTDLRRIILKLNDIIDDFFGDPPTVDINLYDIKTSINTTRKIVDDIVGGISGIVEKHNLLEKVQGKVPHKQINNVVYTVAPRLLTWSQQNKTIKHTAEITGVYILSTFSSAKFEIL